MKKYCNSIICVAILALATACQMEIQAPVADEAVHMVFSAQIEDQATKTIMDGDASSTTRYVTWQEGDEVVVWNGSSSAKFTNIATGNQRTAILDGELAPSSSYYAFYPYAMEADFGDVWMSFTLPSVQTYYEGGFAPASYPMLAEADGGTFTFKNLCGVLVLQLRGTAAITSLSFSAQSEGSAAPVSGCAHVELSNPQHFVMAGDGGSVTLNCPAPVQLDEASPTSFHIVLPPGEYSPFTIIASATDGTSMTIQSDKVLEIVRSRRTTAAPLDYVPTVVTDLSIGGTANSYIVTGEGNYKIKAVKGNSSESVGAVASAEVLWESFGTSTTPSVGDLVSGVSYDNGYISFAASAIKGNAVIAAKDASGEILWSWHIWMTEQPEDQQYFNNAGIMMDRNLGALSTDVQSPLAAGLLYQWGRKDPFPSGDAKSTNIDWGKTYSSAGSLQNPVEKSISDPLTILKENDEHAERSADLWGHEKTVYDPCPVGYRVPDGGLNGVWATAAHGEPFDIHSIGELFGVDGLYASDCQYPTPPYRYWSCTHEEGHGKCSYIMLFQGDTVYPTTNDHPQGVYGVRCLKESSPEIVPVTEVSISPSSIEVEVGGSIQLSAQVLPADANSKTVRWYSDDPGVAQVSFEGLVTAVGAGNCTVTVTSNNGKSASCQVVVSQPVSSVSLDKKNLTLNVGDMMQLNATVIPSNASDTQLEWSTSNSAVAQVSTSGLVTAVGAGNCTVKVKSNNGKSASCQVVVSQPVSSVSLDKTSLSLEVGYKTSLHATISPSNASDMSLYWSTSDSAVAQVSDCIVTAVGAGNCTVTVTSNNGKTASCQVVVYEPAVDMGLSVKWASCNLGATNPEDYGGYYQWAGTSDVSALSNYLSWDNCPYHSGSSDSSGWTKYIPSGYSSYWSGNGSPDDKTTLDLVDDAAHVVLGGKWRMPTLAECEELSSTSNCTWTWTSLNGVNGFKVQSKKSGYTDKWIFLPAAGYRGSDHLNNAGGGYYWSSSLSADDPYYAYALYFGSGRVDTSSGPRYFGLSVRPVSE